MHEAILDGGTRDVLMLDFVEVTHSLEVTKEAVKKMFGQVEYTTKLSLATVDYNHG